MTIQAVLERRIEECKKCLAHYEGIFGRLRTGEMRILTLPEENDDQSALADEYETKAQGLRKHIGTLSGLLAKVVQQENTTLKANKGSAGVDGITIGGITD